MLAHNLKEILSIVPDLKEHIKQANVEKDFPLDNRDGCLASYVRCYYLSKVAGKAIDDEVMEKLTKAAHLYNIGETVKPFIAAIKKYAEEKEKDLLKQAEELTVKQAEAAFEGSLTGFIDIEKAAEVAKSLVAKYGDAITSLEVKRYSGQAYFMKEAAINALQARAFATGKEVFTKIAEIVDRTMSQDPSQKEINDVCEKVTALDKKAGLSLKGFNIYKEALEVNPERAGSVLTVNIAGRPVSYEKISRLGTHRISHMLGKDIADAMTSDPLVNKRILESLPLDQQRVLANILKNV